MSAPQERKAAAPQRKRGAWRHPYEMSRERPPRNVCSIPHYLGYPPNPLGQGARAIKISKEEAQALFY